MSISTRRVTYMNAQIHCAIHVHFSSMNREPNTLITVDLCKGEEAYVYIHDSMIGISVLSAVLQCHCVTHSYLCLVH